jgi:hypothetical protein
VSTQRLAPASISPAGNFTPPLTAFEPSEPTTPDPYHFGLPTRLLAILENEIEKSSDIHRQLARERDFSTRLSRRDRWVGQRCYFGADLDQPIDYQFAEAFRSPRAISQTIDGFDPASYLQHAPDVDPERLKRAIRVCAKRINALHENSKGYLGWLLTTPAFLDEHDRLLDSHKDHILAHGMPLLSRHRLTGSASCRMPTDECHNECFDAFDQFYVRWRLESLAAPGLPVPQTTDFSVFPTEPASSPRNEAGRMFFIPDIFPIPSRELLRNMLEDELRPQGALPDHLEEWGRLIAKSNPSKKGIPRFARLFELQHYTRIVRRRMSGVKQGVLERCLAKLFAQSDATIHRDMLFLRERLGTDWQTRPFGL